MKICPVAAELFHARGWTDGRTDMTKLIIAFRSFPNAPKPINHLACAKVYAHYVKSFYGF